MRIKNVLTSSAAFTSLPLSCLLIGLDALIDLKFLCPCNVENSQTLFWLILFAPACFAFLLMFLLLRPCKYEYEFCSPEYWGYNCCYKCYKDWGPDCFSNCCCICCYDRNDINRKRLNNNHCVKQFVQCLVPPVVWFLVLYDGTYYACYKSYWSSKYVFDDELNIKWCKPTYSFPENDRQRRVEFQGFLVTSKIISYYLLIGFCCAAVTLVGLYDCWKCGKSSNGNSQEENNSTA